MSSTPLTTKTTGTSQPGKLKVVTIAIGSHDAETGIYIACQPAQTAAEMVRATLSESRRLIQDLRPAPLLNSDLHSALREVAQQLTSGTSIRTSFMVKGTPKLLSEPVEDSLFRVAQESISNAVKHGNPEQILLEMKYENGKMRMSIQDDGRGFDIESRKDNSDHFGLIGMRERVNQIGGDLQIESQPDKGTRIEITVPVK